MKIGRNDHCPCGSQKKYKHCCLNQHQEQPRWSTTKALEDQITEAANDAPFASLEELNAFTTQVVTERNQQAVDDFCGLSPEQMHRSLHFPFESPNVVQFSTTFNAPSSVTILRLFTALAEAIGEEGLKATARGNLPLPFCKQLAETFKAENKDNRHSFIGGIRSETDFEELHCTRLVAELAGLVRKYKGRFVLTKKGQQLRTPDTVGKLYLALFQAYTTQFNWGYRDGHPDAGIVQQAFLYTLFLLHQYGEKALPHKAYEEKFLTAFPTALSLFPESSYITAEEEARHCYALRALERFACFFGLAELVANPDALSRRSYTIKKTALLDTFVTFNV